MKSKLFRMFPLALLLLAASALNAPAQEFSKTYHPGAGGSIRIQNVSGDIKISGYSGEGVVVNAYKEGRDRDMVDVEDLSTGNIVELRARYESCRNCSINASIRFEVQVPRSLNLNFDKIETASGNISLEGVTGRIRVNTASGDVRVENVSGVIDANTASGELQVRNIAGAVRANSASGNVNVEMTRVEGSENMSFSTASGDVTVKMPNNLDADVSMSTASGDLRTDFPIEVKKDEYGSGSRARGRLGSGLRSLRISSASGNVQLVRL